MFASAEQKYKISETEVLKTIPKKKLWLRMEADRRLLEPKDDFIFILLRLGMVFSLIAHTPIYMIALWLLISISIIYWMRKLSSDYGNLSIMNPASSTYAMNKIVVRYKQAFLMNALTWGMVSCIYIYYVPYELQAFCFSILLAASAMSIALTNTHRILMHQVTAILIGSQVLFTLIYLSSKIWWNKDSTYSGLQYHIVFILSLLFLSYFLWRIGNRMHYFFYKKMDAEYLKLELIQKLSKANQDQHIDQQALIAADQEIQRFYSAAAHDLRQPIYAMEIYVETMLNEPESADQYLPKIKQSCESIHTMFNSLFDYQKIHALDMNSSLRDISIMDIFDNLKHHYEPLANDKNLSLRFRPLQGSVNMVPMYLIRILSNLITNAIRYTQVGGVIVSARKHKDYLSFEVWDTGIGISEYAKEDIFDEFYKVNNPMSPDEGFGIGLSIVKQLVSRIHGAKIHLESKVGVGSVFKFYIPLSLYMST